MITKTMFQHKIDYFNKYPCHWMMSEILDREDDPRFDGCFDIFTNRFEDKITDESRTFDVHEWEGHTFPNVNPSQMNQYEQMVDQFILDTIYYGVHH